MKFKKEISLRIDSNSDLLGILASGLCMIHCIATPFLFVTQATASVSCAEISPLWWKSIDYIFLVITFFAIYFSAKFTTLKWMPITLYSCWFVLTFLVINASLQLISLPHALIYIPALGLSFLHIYNRRYCSC